MYVAVYMYTHMEYLQRPEETLDSPEARVTGSYESSNMGAGTQILHKSIQCPLRLSHL